MDGQTSPTAVLFNHQSSQSSSLHKPHKVKRKWGTDENEEGGMRGFSIFESSIRSSRTNDIVHLASSRQNIKDGGANPSSHTTA
jgi:hypothetical protein